MRSIIALLLIVVMAPFVILGFLGRFMWGGVACGSDIAEATGERLENWLHGSEGE